MNTTHTAPDWCLRSKVVCILAWHGLTAKDISTLKWTDIMESAGHFTHINGSVINEHEKDILSQWFAKDSY